MKSDKSFLWRYRFWYTVFWIFFVNILIFSLIILLVRPLWSDINYFVSEFTNLKFQWLMLLLIVSIFLTGYGLFLIIRLSPKRITKNLNKIALFPRIFLIPVLIIWDFMLFLLISIGGDEIGIVRTGLEYISPIIFFFLILIMTFSSQKIIFNIIKIWEEIKEQERWKFTFNKDLLIIAGILMIILFGFILPFIFIPVNVIQGDIPPKPKLMAHRGASHLAPENTLIAGQMAAEIGAIGWEVDVSISYDGIFFLMHDSLLKRTTNVEDIFPERINDDATMFNITDLRLLDAGSWFSDDDPYETIADEFVDLQTAENFRGEKIPTLDEVLNLTRDYNLYIDIDSGKPPKEHPFYNQYDELLINQLYDSGLNEKIITRLSSNLTKNMTKISSSQDIASLLEEEVDLLNTIHTLSNDQFQEYQDANITVMVWTVDTVQRFSQVWFLGVDFVKTNALHLLIPLETPVWTINSQGYNLIWTISIILSLIGATLMYILRNRKNLN
ncbi:glycerophosphodiester phosphodiesterase family protein [Promethearchaeum syntrophicum]|uniref:Glycerophosphodiester phosphodiesterase family protein n=1 Tax=Promethearchaeum syntrophicum TaxID=2594042 RepID=A0A5B9DFS5_9ARCH|nr:glycerophosphodiester phosphodiesterase family protein [Candidatus Prometheoarchaeum syntrophicum]QEE17586.1 cytoplasmic glycerophosphodiester phosphodiesterase [Candidatus Prometheoarchaeum syntrophicum]